MSTHRTRRAFVLGITSKISIPLLLGLAAIVSSDVITHSGRSALELGAIVFLGFLLVLNLIDFTARFDGVHEHLSAGFAKIDRSARLFELMEQSVIGTSVLTEFLEAAAKAGPGVSPLLQRLARREIERVTWFVRQLPVGNEIGYDGEDREWLLGLTAEAQRSIDAISLSTVDAGMRGFDGGLWTSDLGTRYLQLQRAAMDRQVAIRRIFVFEHEDLVRDETFMNITQMQRDLGIDVRMLDHQLIPEWLRSMIFDFIIFDRAVSYETTPATTFNAGGTRPAIVRTVLAPKQNRVDDLVGKFEQLWDAADPDREIGE
jgi:hypothetical protein